LQPFHRSLVPRAIAATLLLLAVVAAQWVNWLLRHSRSRPIHFGGLACFADAYTEKAFRIPQVQPTHALHSQTPLQNDLPSLFLIEEPLQKVSMIGVGKVGALWLNALIA
jgi:hypothetical protein